MNQLIFDRLARYLFSVSIVLAVLSACVVFFAGAYIGSYNDLTFDDIARKVAGNHSIIGGAIAFYFGETGRFTNGLITQYSGLYELRVYRYLHIVNGLLWVFSLGYFIHSFLQYLKVPKSNSRCVVTNFNYCINYDLQRAKPWRVVVLVCNGQFVYDW